MTQQLPATLDDIAQAQAAGTQAALEGADPRTNPWPIDSTDERLAFLARLLRGHRGDDGRRRSL